MPSESGETGLRTLVSLERFGKFASVGVVGAACDFAVLAALVVFASMNPTLAKAFSAETAIVAMFVMNEVWTFADHGASGSWNVARRLLRSNVVRAGGALWALGVLHLLTTYADVWYLAANAVGIGTGFAINYLFESLATWKVHQ
jgi:putative flippase GtrA